jgi:tetratricopeptide (TPR) repeat protein
MSDLPLAQIELHVPRVRRSARRWTSILCVGGLALLALVQPRTASAQPSPTQPSPTSEATNLDIARSIAVTGREAFNAGDYETALAMFRKAYQLYPAPTVVLYEARTLERLGLLIEALEAYTRTTQLPVPNHAPAQFAEAIAAAREESAVLSARVPKLVLVLRGVTIDDPNLSVSINGRALDRAQLREPQRLNPGTYRIAATAGVDRRFDTEATLVPGQSRRIVVNLTASPSDPLGVEGDGAAKGVIGSEPPSHHSIPLIAYVAGGVGVAGVGAGVITGLLANGKYDDAERLCEDHRCAPGTPGLDAVDAFRTWRMVSSVSYGVGAAGLAAGVVLWLTASDDDDAGRASSIQPWGTAKTAGVRGTF